MDISAVLLLALWTSASAAGFINVGLDLKRPPLLTLCLCGLLALFLAAQLAYPTLLDLFQRDVLKILQGQWWRVFTALFFQDGWVAGGVTNIFALLLIGGLAEQILGPSEWVAVCLIGASIAECVALWWQPVGAGNSVAVCALAGGVVVSRPYVEMQWQSRLLGLVSVVAALVLAIMRDIHGVAALAGVAAEFILRHSRRDRPSVARH
jgi:rhomboid protease GluP